MAANAGEAYVTIIPEMSGFATGVGKGINRIGNQLTRTGRVLTRGITIPVAAAGAASIKMALDYQTSIQRVGSLTNASRGQVKAWSDQILTLGPKLAVAPNDFAQSLYFVASSGAKVSQVMPITTASVKLAAAGMGDASTVAQILTSAVNAYGESNLSAAQAADVLTEAIKVGKAEPAALASALGRVIPLAQAMGVTFAEAAASVSTLTNTGLSAAEATTALRAVLTTMVKPAQQTKDEYKKLGFTVDGLQKSIAEHGLNDTLVMMKKRIGDNKDALGKLFPNVRALTGFLALTGKNAAQVARNVDLVTHSTGAANKAFKRAAESDAFKFRKALAQLQVAAVRLGTALLPVAVDLLNDLEGLVQAFDGLSDSQKRWIITGLLVAATIGPIVTLIGNFTIILGGAVRGLSLLGTAFYIAAGAGASLTASNELVTTSFLEMDAAALPIIGSFTLIATGAAIITGIALVAWFELSLGSTNRFADSQRDAAAATKELSSALAELKTGNIDLRQANLDHRRATEQLVKDERKQIKYIHEHGHANHQLAEQIIQDGINVDSAEVRQRQGHQEVADAAAKQREALKKLLKAQQETGSEAKTAAANYLHKLNPALFFSQKATDKLRKSQIIAADTARRFVQELGNQNIKLVDSGKKLTGASLKTALLNQAAEDLTLKLGHVPTSKQIDVYFKNNMDKLRQEVEDLRAQLDALHDKSITVTTRYLSQGRISGHRAVGGPVAANTPYLVGERGPELFVSHSSGTIVPNHKLGMGGGRVRMVIDNWEEGTAYIESIADDSVGRNSNLNRQRRRMSR